MSYDAPDRLYFVRVVVGDSTREYIGFDGTRFGASLRKMPAPECRWFARAP
jgi:hypothetical protein